MKRHMILFPLLLAALFLISTLLYMAKPQFSLVLKTSSGNIREVEGLQYSLTLADDAMRWEVNGNGAELTYTTAFLKEHESLSLEYATFSDGFYLYIPRLLEGKKLTDYELEQSKPVDDMRYEEQTTAGFYNVDDVSVDLLVKTDKGYACFPSGLHQSFPNTRGTILHLQADDQLYFKSNPKRYGKLKGEGLWHPYTKLKDKTLVTLYDAGNGTSGRYRVFEIEKALKSEDMPDIKKARQETRVAEFIVFDPSVVTISDMISYNDQLYVAVQKNNQSWLQLYDANGQLIKEEKLQKNIVFHHFDIQEDKLLILTSKRNESYLDVYDKETQIMRITSPISLASSKLKLQGNKLFALNLKQLESSSQHQLEISVFDSKKLVFDGYVRGEFEEDEKAYAHFKQIQRVTPAEQDQPVMPAVKVRDIYAYGFRE